MAQQANAQTFDFFKNSYTYYGLDDALLWEAPLSGWGSAAVNYEGASQTQYFNLAINGEWKVVNMTLGAFAGVGASTSVMFNFGIDQPLGAGLDYGWAISDTPLGAAPVGGSSAVLGERQIIGSINDGTSPIVAWALGAPEFALAGGEVGSGGVHVGFPNQNCDTNFCVPAAVSNSLQWLNKKYGLKMPEDKISIATLAEKFGTTKKDATPGGWWDKKKKYLKDNKLPVEQSFLEGKNAFDDAVKAIADGKDVEMYAGPFTGGHIFSIVGLEKLKDGTYELSVAHDTKQGPSGPGEKGEGGTVIEKGIYDPTAKTLTGITFVTKNATRFFFVVESAVPEPATWLMLIAGFALAGWQLRRGVRASVTFA